MAAAIQHLDYERTRPAPMIGQDEMALLNHLRFVSMACRAKPRTELFEACALLHLEGAKAEIAYAEALMRCMGEALGQPARLHAPGSDELTFDEKWLLQLYRAYLASADDSIRFLLRSRIGHENRRLVGFLMGRIAERFSQD